MRAGSACARGQPLAATVGALVPHKDHATLLHAARRLTERFPTLHWVIAGRRAELLRVLERLRDQLGLGDRVHFLGQIPEPDGPHGRGRRASS